MADVLSLIKELKKAKLDEANWANKAINGVKHSVAVRLTGQEIYIFGNNGDQYSHFEKLIPDGLSKHVEKAIKARLPEILAEARNERAREIDKAIASKRKEVEELLQNIIKMESEGK